MSDPFADGMERNELPDPEKVADELAEISRRLDSELKSDEHGWLNAADEYLRSLETDTDQRGESR